MGEPTSGDYRSEEFNGTALTIHLDPIPWARFPDNAGSPHPIYCGSKLTTHIGLETDLVGDQDGPNSLMVTIALYTQ